MLSTRGSTPLCPSSHAQKGREGNRVPLPWHQMADESPRAVRANTHQRLVAVPAACAASAVARPIRIAATAVTKVAPASVATAELLVRACFLDRKCPSLHLFPIEQGDGLSSLRLSTHLDKTVSPTLPGERIHDHMRRCDSACLGKHLRKVRVVDVEGKVGHKEIGAHMNAFYSFLQRVLRHSSRKERQKRYPFSEHGIHPTARSHRAALHGKGAKPARFSMEGQDNWVQYAQYIL